MIIWRELKEKDLPKILEKVGMKRRSNVSNTFLVWGGFKGAEPRWECYQAYIIRYNNNDLKISIYGLSGTIGVSHYSLINNPRVKVRINKVTP